MTVKREPGFSLLETVIVVALIAVVTAISIFNIAPALRVARVNSAHNAIIAALTAARERAIAERRVYMVSFILPRTITQTMSATGTVVETTMLPQDVIFSNEPGIPNTITTTPDGFGIGVNAIDFDIGVGLGGANTVYFYPDGSARDINGRINNGVVYLARPGELMSSRAVTVFGITGRIRGWQLRQNSAGTRYWGQI